MAAIKILVFINIFCPCNILYLQRDFNNIPMNGNNPQPIKLCLSTLKPGM